jgi:hypothetical protein
MFEIGEEVKCIDASMASHMREELERDFEIWLRQGSKYKIRGFNENDGIVVGVLLEEVHNYPKYFKLLGCSQEPSFKTDRFRKLQPNEAKENVNSEEEILTH